MYLFLVQNDTGDNVLIPKQGPIHSPSRVTSLMHVH